MSPIGRRDHAVSIKIIITMRTKPGRSDENISGAMIGSL
jgi:hypothetical protein